MGITGFPDSKTLHKYKGILIDLDNTLYLHDTCHKTALKSVFEAFKDTLGTITYTDFKNVYDKGRKVIQSRLLPTGSCRSRLLYFHAMLDEVGLSANVGLALTMQSVYVTTFLDTMKLDSQAMSFLKLAKEHHLRICIVTNLTSQFQMQKLDTLTLHPYIDALVTSEEAGVEKPNPLIFQLGLEKLRLQSHEVLMIGDDEKKDIKGAQALGITAWKVTVNE